ncbi:hypothetical protein Tco_1297872 [Tanacetum coccineum]
MSVSYIPTMWVVNDTTMFVFIVKVGNGTQKPNNFSTPYFSTDSPSGANHLPKHNRTYSCDIRGNDSHLHIKSSVEDLVPIPSESEGIPDKMCDVPLCENTTPLNALNEHSEVLVNSDDVSNSSSDDVSPYGEDIDFVECITIDSLRDNPTPSSEVVIKSTSTFPNLFLEETNTFDNSIPESETFRFNLEEISSGSPTTRFDLSHSDYKAFLPV